MTIDPFALLRPEYARDLRPELDQRYHHCLSCAEALREPQERRTGLHTKCVAAWARKTTGHVEGGL